MQAIAPYPVEKVLRDGTPVLIRPLGPDDKHLLEEGMENLSPRARYLRFFRPLSELPAAMLKRFTEIDHSDHEAIGALDLNGPEPEPVGVARYIRTSNDRALAEVAVTVVDSHQGRGLGTLLLAFLARSAVRNEIQAFTAIVLLENTGMLQVFHELGGTTKFSSDGEAEVHIPLPEDPSLFPETPAGNVFRDVFSADAD